MNNDKILSVRIDLLVQLFYGFCNHDLPIATCTDISVSMLLSPIKDR